ncbi:hypothetical protein AOQ72_17315 [Bradyrhizobium yuanmingense]|uniref:Uncharacterized protein n=1 Tax=Bradyrhizobium yuanmingense TaxID=108015 RepID=A0A0R3CHY0_9BRAD|nr:hypothetical protein AOQ72_17315 [Bradyrhizobium yuanmingense]
MSLPRFRPSQLEAEFFTDDLILRPLGSPPRELGTIAFASRHAFFEAELLGMHEVPHRVIVDLQAASGKLGNEPAYGEIAVPDSLRQPDHLLARNRLRFVATDLTWLNAAGLIDRFIQPMAVLIATPNCLAA